MQIEMSQLHVCTHISHACFVRRSFFAFQSRLDARKERLYKSLCDIVWLSVRGNTPPPKHDFWAAQAILSNFCFWKTKNSNFFFTQNVFLPKILFHPNFFFSLLKKVSHFQFFIYFQMFYAILSAQKNFHPKFFWVKQGATQCYQAFLVFDIAGTTVPRFRTCHVKKVMKLLRFGSGEFGQKKVERKR